MTGHIRKRSKGSWTVVVPLDRDPVTGKRRQLWGTVVGSKKDAQRLLTDLLHQRDTGIDAPPGRMTVATTSSFGWIATPPSTSNRPRSCNIDGLSVNT